MISQIALHSFQKLRIVQKGLGHNPYSEKENGLSPLRLLARLFFSSARSFLVGPQVGPLNNRMGPGLPISESMVLY